MKENIKLIVFAYGTDMINISVLKSEQNNILSSTTLYVVFVIVLQLRVSLCLDLAMG